MNMKGKARLLAFFNLLCRKVNSVLACSSAGAMRMDTSGVTAPTGAIPALEAKCFPDGSRLAGTVEGYADRQNGFVQFACAFAITHLNVILSSMLTMTCA
jgi:hypothetical protein